MTKLSHRRNACLAATIAIAAMAPLAMGQLYSITAVPVAGATYAAGEEVSESGIVAGGSFDTNDVTGAFVRPTMVAVLPGLTGGTGAYANSVNDAGTAVGYANNADGDSRAVAWPSAGTIVGDSRNAAGVTRPFAWTSAGGMVELPVTLGGAFAGTAAVNATGVVVGAATISDGNRHAYRFDSATSTTTDLGTLGGDNSFANGISPNGLVVGLNDLVNDEFHPFAWSSTSGMVDLFAAGDLGSPYGSAYDANSAGQVVGYGEINDDFDSHAFVWSASAGLQNLNDLIPAGTGWTLFSAAGINDAGQITGWGELDGVPTAYLVTVVPEPAAFSSLVVASLGLLRRRRAYDCHAHTSRARSFTMRFNPLIGIGVTTAMLFTAASSQAAVTFDLEDQTVTGFNGGALTSLTLTDPNLSVTITRPGTPSRFDLYDINGIGNATFPTNWGVRFISPWFSNAGTAMVATFDRPVQSVSIDMGDFGGDPDSRSRRSLRRHRRDRHAAANDDRHAAAGRLGVQRGDAVGRDRRAINPIDPISRRDRNVRHQPDLLDLDSQLGLLRQLGRDGARAGGSGDACRRRVLVASFSP